MAATRSTVTVWAGNRSWSGAGQVCLQAGKGDLTRSGKSDFRPDGRLIDITQAAWEKSRNISRSVEVHGPRERRRRVGSKKGVRPWHRPLQSVMRGGILPGFGGNEINRRVRVHDPIPTPTSASSRSSKPTAKLTII